VEVDSRQLELIALSLLAALGCGVAWTLDKDIIAAVFAGGERSRAGRRHFAIQVA
jgi:alkylhydroperoxidase/carboxymuconolactone decarboxylase family protein YurZ